MNQRMKVKVQQKARKRLKSIKSKSKKESISTRMRWRDKTCCINTRKSKRSLNGSLKTIRATSKMESPCQKPSTR